MILLFTTFLFTIVLSNMLSVFVRNQRQNKQYIEPYFELSLLIHESKL